MKKPFLLLCLLALGFAPAGAQEMTLSKGYVMDSLPLADSVGSRLSLYLVQKIMVVLRLLLHRSLLRRQSVLPRDLRI